MAIIDATIDEIIFRNDENGFTVLSVEVGKNHTCAVGTLPNVAAGEHVVLTGDWKEHAQYGKQFAIESCEWIKPDSTANLVAMLGSRWIRGIGKAMAKRIVSAFGMESLDVIQYHPDKLATVSGISKKRAQLISASLAEQQGTREAMVFLQGFGVSPQLGLRIYKQYGDKAADILRANPYKLVEDVRGVGFKTADDIARSMGLAVDSPFRVHACIVHLLRSESVGNGHCYLPRETLITLAQNLLTLEREQIERELIELILKRRIIEREIDDARVIYLRNIYEAEGEAARRLSQLLSVAPSVKTDDITAQIKRFETETGRTLDDCQREAAICALNNGVCVITGGPGTGKTTIIRLIIDLLSFEGGILLCAPTGRAAKRMTEATSHPSKTIHRLLEYSGDAEHFNRDADNPLDCKTIITDEASMIDIFLMRALLRAVVPGTRFIIVGDADQLPSVGAGDVLSDIIKSGVIPSIHLTKVHRQDEHSMIAINAHSINKGEMPSLNDKLSDFFLDKQNLASDAANALIELMTKRLPNFLNLHGSPFEHIQALSPMKKGECGVFTLNTMLQERLNPRSRDKNEYKRGDTIFRVGDKIMQTRNNYKLEWMLGEEQGAGVFNGDIGFIDEIEDDTITVRFDDGRVAMYEPAQVEDLELAYCISVHKSQGSEFPVVIMPVVGGPPMLLTRNLLYTAVTRARRLVVLVGREDCLRRMVENYRVEERYSSLAKRLKDSW